MNQIIKTLYNILNTHNDKVYDILLYGDDIRLITHKHINLDDHEEIIEEFTKSYQCTYKKFGDNIIILQNPYLGTTQKIYTYMRVKTDFYDFYLTCVHTKYIEEPEIELSRTSLDIRSYKYKDVKINITKSPIYKETITEFNFTRSSMCDILELICMIYPRTRNKICDSLGINYSLRCKNMILDKRCKVINYSGDLKISCHGIIYNDFESISLKDLYCSTDLKIVSKNKVVLEIRPKLVPYDDPKGVNQLLLFSNTEYISSSNNHVLTLYYHSSKFHLLDKYNNVILYDMFNQDVIKKFYTKKDDDNETKNEILEPDYVYVPINNLTNVSINIPNDLVLRNGNKVDAKVIKNENNICLEILSKNNNKIISTVKDCYIELFNIYPIDYKPDITLMYATKMYIKSGKSVLMLYNKFDLPNRYNHISNIVLCGPNESYIYNPLYNATQNGKICYVNYFTYQNFNNKSLTNGIIKIKNIIKLDCIYIDDKNIVNNIDKLQTLNKLNMLDEQGRIILIRNGDDEEYIEQIKRIFTNFDVKIDHPMESSFVINTMRKINNYCVKKDTIIIVLDKK